jgi:hypothetical protein
MGGGPVQLEGETNALGCLLFVSIDALLELLLPQSTGTNCIRAAFCTADVGGLGWQAMVR